MSSVLSKAEARNLKKALRSVEELGKSVDDPFMANLPDDLKVPRDALREKFKMYRNRPVSEIVSAYRNTPRVFNLYNYMAIAASTLSLKGNIHFESVYKALAKLYETCDDFREIVEKGFTIRKNIYSISEKFVRIYREISSKEFPTDNVRVGKVWKFTIINVTKLERRREAGGDGIVEFLAKIDNMRVYTELVESRIFRNPLVEVRFTRSAKLFTKWTIHPEITVPAAVKLIQTGKVRSYIPLIDPYSAFVIFRTGLFKLAFLRLSRMNDLQRQKLFRIYRMLEEEGKKGIVKLKLSAIDDIVNIVIHLADDVVAVENGLHYIGKKLCREGKCSECPLKEFCEGYNVLIK